MCESCKACRSYNKKKLATSSQTEFSKVNLGREQSGDFADHFLKAEALLRFYFNMSSEEINAMDGETFALRYRQMEYAMEFDAKRQNLEKGQKLYMPL